jgi:Ca2+-binding RTX toxin-like protein
VAGESIGASDARVRLINDGTIKSIIRLGSGDDVVDTRGGTIRNGVEGGGGDDTLITDDRKVTLYEQFGEGTDTVKSTVSYALSDNVDNLVLLGRKDTKGIGNSNANTLRGNAGDNILSAGDGVDVLAGGRGNDTLTGGLERDTFIFKTGDGHDVITDFETIDEHLDVSNWNAVGSYDNLRHHMTNEQGGVMITFGQDSVFLDHLTKSDIHGNNIVL